MLPRHQALALITNQMQDYVEAIGYQEAADACSVSSDTIRRRVRGEKAWQLEELIDLLSHEDRHSRSQRLAAAVRKCIEDRKEDSTYSLKLPSELREVLRMVGHTTVEIATTLEDGRVDEMEADRLLTCFSDLRKMIDTLEPQLGNIASK